MDITLKLTAQGQDSLRKFVARALNTLEPQDWPEWAATLDEVLERPWAAPGNSLKSTTDDMVMSITGIRDNAADRMADAIRARNGEPALLPTDHMETVEQSPKRVYDAQGWYSDDGGLSWTHPAPNASTPAVPTSVATMTQYEAAMHYHLGEWTKAYVKKEQQPGGLLDPARFKGL